MINYDGLLLYVYKFLEPSSYVLDSVIEHPVYVQYKPTYNSGGTFNITAKITQQNAQSITKNSIIRIEENIIGVVKSITTSANGLMKIGGTLGDSVVASKSMMQTLSVEEKSPGEILELVYESMEEPAPGLQVQNETSHENPQTGDVVPENYLSLVQKLCQRYNLGYQITCNDLSENCIDFTLRIFSGEDKSEDVFLSQNYGNLSEFEYDVSYSDEINYVKVIGENDIVVEVQTDPAPSTPDRMEYYLDCTGVKQENLTEQQYRKVLEEKGMEIILNHKPKETFSGDCISQTYLPLEDYFLGDIVSVIDIHRDLQSSQRFIGYTKEFDTKGVYFSGNFGEVQNTSAKVITSLTKRIQKLEDDKNKATQQNNSGVGEFLDSGHTTERFNDYSLNSSVMKYDHIEGQNNKILNTYGNPFQYSGYNHIEGQNNTLNGSSGDCTHIEGNRNTYTGGGNGYNHIEGYYNTLTRGMQNHLTGMQNNSTDSSRMQIGGQRNVSNNSSDTFICGDSNNAQRVQTSIISGQSHSVTGDGLAVFGINHQVQGHNGCICGQHGILDGTQYFAVGAGSLGNNENCFEVRGSSGVFANGGYHDIGADYAEYFEWLDGNLEKEYRCGILVELSKNKIIPATGSTIFGAISGNPSVVGNAYELYWHGKYARDVYGKVITTKLGEPLLSPDYDPNKKYIPRSKRPEWAVVGILGKLIVRDNGECIPGDFCGAINGIAVPSKHTKTRVLTLRRIDNNHIEVVIGV